MIELAIVSMPSATVRREGISRHLDQGPYPWRFQDAGPGTGYVPYDPRQAIRVYGRELNAAERGAFESHVRAIRHFVEHGQNEFVMICEDDIRIDFDFPMADLLSAMEAADVEFIRLFGRRMAPVRHIQSWRNRWLVRFIWEPFGMQCYILSRAGAARLLERLSTAVRPIDDELDRFWENGLPAYAIFPFPVMEMQSPSTVIRMPDKPTRLQKTRRNVMRLIDRIRAVAHGWPLSKKDRAFRAALLRTGI